MLENGRPKPNAALLVTFVTNGKPLYPKPKVGDPLPDGTQIQAPVGIAVVISRSDNKSTITVHPGSNLTLISTTSTGVAAALKTGSAEFDVVPHALDFFTVNFRQFTASVRGTAFKVDAKRNDVRFTCARGVVNIIRTVTLYLPADQRVIHGVKLVDQISSKTSKSRAYAVDEGEYLRTWGTLAGAASYFNAQLSAAEASHDADRIDAALTSLSDLYADEGIYARAQDIGQRRLSNAMLRQAMLGDRTVAESYDQIADIYRLQGRTDAFFQNASRAIAIWQRADPLGLQAAHAEADRIYGGSLQELGRVNEANAAYQHGVTIAARVHDPVAQMQLEENLGSLSSDLHDWNGELAHDLRALDFAKTAYPAGRSTRLAALYQDLATGYYESDRFYIALEYARDAVLQWRSITGNDDNERVASATVDYVRVILKWGQFWDKTRPLDVVNAALANLRHGGLTDSSTAARLLQQRAQIYTAYQRDADAKLDYETAFRVLKALGMSGAAARLEAAYSDLQQAASNVGDYTAALEYATDRVRLSEHQGLRSPLRIAQAEDSLGDAYANLSQVSSAASAYRSAVKQLIAVGSPASRLLADEYSKLAAYEAFQALDAGPDARAALQSVMSIPFITHAAVKVDAVESNAADSSWYPLWVKPVVPLAGDAAFSVWPSSDGHWAVGRNCQVTWEQLIAERSPDNTVSLRVVAVVGSAVSAGGSTCRVRFSFAFFDQNHRYIETWSETTSLERSGRDGETAYTFSGRLNVQTFEKARFVIRYADNGPT